MQNHKLKLYKSLNNVLVLKEQMKAKEFSKEAFVASQSLKPPESEPESQFIWLFEDTSLQKE